MTRTWGKQGLVGKRFESEFQQIAGWQGIAITRIPDGCKVLGGGKIIRVKSPFDWVLTKDGKTALIDTKTTLDKNFKHGKIDLAQLAALYDQQFRGAIAGYVVQFRSLKTVKFFSAGTLKAAVASKSNLVPADGVTIGENNVMNVAALFAGPKNLGMGENC